MALKRRKLFWMAFVLVTAVIFVIGGDVIYIHFFSTPAISVLVNQKASQVDRALITLEQAAVMVHYDDTGKVWLTGRSANDTRSFTIDQLPNALAHIHAKGTAFISHVYTSQQSGINGLLGYTPLPNVKLEKQIRIALIAAGFTVPT
jgi:hypothetical protein